MPFSNFIDKARYSQSDEVREEAAERWLNQNRGLITDGDTIDYQALKFLMRQGIPDRLRGMVWREILHVGDVPVHERDYGSSLLRIFGRRVPDNVHPPNFGSTVDIDCLALSPNGRIVVRNILCIMGHDYPNLEFCPFLPSITALLTHQMSAYDAMGCVLSMIKRPRRHGTQASNKSSNTMDSQQGFGSYFPQHRVDIQRFIGTFDLLVKKMLPRIGKHLKRLSQQSLSSPLASSTFSPKLGPAEIPYSLSPISTDTSLAPPSSRTASSYTSKRLSAPPVPLHFDLPPSEPVFLEYHKLLCNIFIGIYPHSFIFRIIDALVTEGYKVLYRFGLGHMMWLRDLLLQTTSIRQFNEVLTESRVDSMTDVAFSRIVELSFSMSFSRTLLVQLRSRVIREEGTPNYLITSPYLSESQMGGSEFDVGSSQSIGASQMFFKPVPVMETPSDILNINDWAFIWSWVPKRYRLRDLRLSFATHRDGYHLNTLYDRVGVAEPLILVIETVDGPSFGAFMSASVKPTVHASHGYKSFSESFHGTGETFIFSISPEREVYYWVGKDASMNVIEHRVLNEESSFFILGANDFLAVGGGGGCGYSIWVDSSLTKCSSATSATFNNPPLTGTNDKVYECAGVEVFSFI